MENHKCLKEGEFAEVKTNIKSIFQRIDEMRNIYANLNKLTESVHTLSVSVSVFAEQMRDTKDDIKNIKQDISYMKNIPVSEYNDIKRAVTSAVIGVVVGVLATAAFGGML